MTADAPLATAALASAAPHRTCAPWMRARRLAPERVAIQVTADRATYGKLEAARALLGPAVPSHDLAQVLDRALDALLVQLERRRCGVGAGARRAPRASANPPPPPGARPPRGVGAANVAHLAHAPLEQRVKAAIASLAPAHVRPRAVGTTG